MGFKPITDWVANGSKVSRPIISIGTTGKMFWNGAVIDVFRNGSKKHIRLYYDNREKLLAFSFCRIDSDGAVEIKPSPKAKIVSFSIVRLFQKLDLNWENYIGKYLVHGYESDHVIDFYIDLKGHGE